MSDATAVGSASHRQVGFVEAIQLFFKNYVNFQGRSSRGAYWWWVLASVIISIVLRMFDAAIFGGAELLGGLFSLAILLPSISLSVRRLHDIGRSGWWLLILVVPFIVYLVSLVATIVAAGGVGDPTLFGPGALNIVLGLVVLASLIVLIVWACLPGQRTANAYGPDVEAGK